MNKNLNFSFEEAFEQGMLESEFKRSIVISCILGLIVTTQISIVLFDQDLIHKILIDPNRIYLVFLLTGSALFYELFACFGLKALIRAKKPLPKSGRYINAFLEASIPSAGLFLMISSTNIIAPLHGPPVFIYFLFIISGALRLDFRLCFFTGFVAAMEYLGLLFYYLNLNQLSRETTPLPFPFYTSVPVLLILGGLLSGFISIRIKNHFIHFLEKSEERQKVMNVFGQHVSPQVVNQLLSQDVEFKGHVQHVCMMFLDIRDFTTFSEHRSPIEVVNYLNTLFQFMIESVNQHQGIINKFLGDGFMAVFGAPLSSGNDSKNAVAASLEIIEKVKVLNEKKEIPPTKIGIGLHAGEVVTGNVGSPLRKEYTIIGDVVNLASRIEQLNKRFDSSLLISEDVKEGIDLPAEQMEALEPLQVKGRQTPIQIYKII